MAEGGTAEDVWTATRVRFGGLLRSVREGSRLTQVQLAAAMTSAGVTTSGGALSDLERGIGVKPPKEDVIRCYLDQCVPHLEGGGAVQVERRRAVERAFEALSEVYEHFADLAADRRARGGVPSAVGSPAADLPRDAHAFTGRVEELGSLIDAVEAGGVVAVHAVDGMPGVGKTAFAVHAAHVLADHFPDGQVFLDLYGHTAGRSPLDPHDALAALLSAVGVDPLTLPADTAQRAARWRTALSGKRVLLVLDNAADHAQVAPLLPGEGRCLVLVTSRRRLVELDAVSIDLASLPAHDAEEMFRRLAGRPVAEPAALAELVELAGRLPLALAILAARLRNRRALTVTRLVEELTAVRNRLTALRSGDRAVAAAFELSYRDLPPARRRFFRLLGLHPGGGVERHAAAALCGVTPDEAGEHLLALYDEHLVDEVAVARFRMHDLIAEYARDLVVEDDRPAEAKRSLLDHYERVARIADHLIVHGTPPDEVPPDVPPLADAAAAMDLLDLERTNMVACLDATDEPTRIVGLSLALAPYLRRTGPWDLALRIHRRAGDAAPADDPAVRGRALLDLGKIAFYADHYEEAENALATAGRISAEAGLWSTAAHALATLGQLWRHLGKLGDAEGALSEALALHEREGDAGEVADVLVELGTLYYFADDYPAAIEANQRALAIHRELGDAMGQAVALKGLAHAWLFSDDYDNAHDAAARALELYEAARARLGTGQARALLGSVERARGRFAEAREHFDAAIEVYDELKDRSGKAMALIDLGVVLYRLGDYPAGERALRDALTLYDTFEEPHGQAAARRELAELLIRVGRLPEARAVLDEAEDIYGKLDDRFGKALTSSSYGAWHLAAGDARTARGHYETALLLALEIASPLEEAAARAGLGRVARALGDHGAAERHLTDALAIYRRLGAGEARELARELSTE